ncbi:hypothetical protein L3X38_004484 [Prunus dulcis]|uniref:Uncharacterized protein n=1 Tax=Prunus dulcis TaxID=3755 RepID=A0AAD4ZP00_PRUDU|nr:hypothetical protein L3X38_004484 [Prunus dulcis]
MPDLYISQRLTIFSHIGGRKIDVTPRNGSAVAGYCPLWAWLHSHQPARFCFWELMEQLPRVVTHPGIAPASNSLNFGVPTNPKPVSSQKPSYKLGASHLARYCPLWAHSIVSRKDLFRGSYILTPQRPPTRWMRASNSLNFGVPTNPKPVSSQKASYKLGTSHLARYCPLWAHSTVSRKDLFRGSYILTPQRPPTRWMRGVPYKAHHPLSVWSMWDLTIEAKKMVRVDKS